MSTPRAVLTPDVEILHLYISEAHNFFGHHGQEPGTARAVACDGIECVAGAGVRGDRFFNYKDDYKGQITFFACEVYAELRERLNARDRDASALRRNVVTRGVDLNALVGREFTVQGVHFYGMAECSPCYWMDRTFAPGAEELMRGRGGLRARILTNGTLRVNQRFK